MTIRTSPYRTGEYDCDFCHLSVPVAPVWTPEGGAGSVHLCRFCLDLAGSAYDKIEDLTLLQGLSTIYHLLRKKTR